MYSSYCPHKTTGESAAHSAAPNQASNKKRRRTIGMTCANLTVPGSTRKCVIDIADQYITEQAKDGREFGRAALLRSPILDIDQC